jgi:DNA-directed RNA polymerase alpha subunit
MDDDLDKKLKINIHKDLFITTRTSNCLQDQGVSTIQDLIGYNEKQLLTFPKLGKTGLAEIKAILYDLNLKLQKFENNIDQQLDRTSSKDDNVFYDKPNIEFNQQSDQNNIKKITF